MKKSLEILAPAGDMNVLNAALETGADAVYLGLQSLNARRGASNFTPENLSVAVTKAHAANAKIYLTLNTDIAQRELNQALRALQLASDTKVDAVLVKDAALLPLIPLFPSLDFHFSTQAAITNSAGIKAAERLGIKRCVLARELNSEEIAACAAASKSVETEVFVQGALCFSVSGRCLMSSWVGGRSGNRGCCASPCRVPWKRDDSEACKPFSMHDLSLVSHLAELAEIGVDSLKIEGRLKRSPWVSRAIALYRRALSGEGAVDDALGDYTGRRQTDGYFTADYEDLVGDSGRVATFSASMDSEEIVRDVLAMEIKPDIERRGHLFTLTYGSETEVFRLPPREVKKPKKAIAFGELCENLQALVPETFAETEVVSTVDPEQLLVPTSARQVEDFVAGFVRKRMKAPDVTLRYPLPETLKDYFAMQGGCAENKKKLGTAPDRVRLDIDAVASFTKVHPQLTAIVECRNAADVEKLCASLARNAHAVVALPPVIFQSELPEIHAVLDRCGEHHLPVEVNGWDMWFTAVERKLPRIEAGPGLAVLNAAAAKTLYALGCRCVMLSAEADKVQLETMCEAAETPLSLMVYGRPPLFISRVPVPDCATPESIFEDGRGVRITARREGGVSVYRPEQAFNWRHIVNEKIRVTHLVADLTGSKDPLLDYAAMNDPKSTAALFNYGRSLR